MPEQLPGDVEIDITAADAHAYDVTITHRSGAETSHHVTVPEPLLAELGVSDAQEPLLVRASLVYLMEHSPAAIADRFALDEIGTALPDYPSEITSRL